MKTCLKNMIAIFLTIITLTSCGEKGGKSSELGLSDKWVVGDGKVSLFSKNYYDIDEMPILMKIVYESNYEFDEEIKILTFHIVSNQENVEKIPTFSTEIDKLEIKNYRDAKITFSVANIDNILYIMIPDLNKENYEEANEEVMKFILNSDKVSIKTKLSNGKSYTWNFNTTFRNE